jgi:hypothetical protein
MKESAVFSALQMLILSTAELQIRQDEACAEREKMHAVRLYCAYTSFLLV